MSSSPNSEPHSHRQREAAAVSQLDRKDRADILLQQIIDEVARLSKGRLHEHVVSELATTIAEQELPGRPRPWLDAVAASAIDGHAYVVSATTAQVSDVPPPGTDRSGETIT